MYVRKKKKKKIRPSADPAVSEHLSTHVVQPVRRRGSGQDSDGDDGERTVPGDVVSSESHGETVPEDWIRFANRALQEGLRQVVMLDTFAFPRNKRGTMPMALERV